LLYSSVFRTILWGHARRNWISERVRDGYHCRTNPKVTAKVMINAPNQ
jgi:hypothetical protein